FTLFRRLPGASLFPYTTLFRSSLPEAVSMSSIWRSRKWLVDVIALVAILVLGALGVNWWFWPSMPLGSADEVEAVTVDLMPEIKDRKSTRLNSSHRTTSHAVLC